MEIKTLEDLFDAGGLTNEHISETGDSNPVAWEYFRAEALKQFLDNNPLLKDLLDEGVSNTDNTTTRSEDERQKNHPEGGKV